MPEGPLMEIVRQGTVATTSRLPFFTQTNPGAGRWKTAALTEHNANMCYIVTVIYGSSREF